MRLFGKGGTPRDAVSSGDLARATAIADATALTYNPDGSLAQTVETLSDGRTRTTSLTYTAGLLTKVVEAITGGPTRTTTLTYANGVLTSTTVVTS